MQECVVPQLVVRRLLHRVGYRYRLHRGDLPGKPDLVFGNRRQVIFVHGCFWHQHDVESCRDGRLPKSNTFYWKTKFARNVQRDALHISQPKSKGFKELIVWECELGDNVSLLTRLQLFLGLPDQSKDGFC